LNAGEKSDRHTPEKKTIPSPNKVLELDTLIERRSSSWMRYSAVPASALLLGASLPPEDPFSKSLGASETEQSYEKVRICN
jgi:hypothetical protein